MQGVVITALDLQCPWNTCVIFYLLGEIFAAADLLPAPVCYTCACEVSNLVHSCNAV